MPVGREEGGRRPRERRHLPSSIRRQVGHAGVVAQEPPWLQVPARPLSIHSVREEEGRTCWCEMAARMAM